MGKRIKNLLVLIIAATALMGMVARADTSFSSFSFSLMAAQSNTIPSSTQSSTASDAAYVAIQSISPSTAALTFQMVNAAGAPRSSEETITGIGYAYLTYLGYGINIGDELYLRVTNNVSDNGGVALYVSGIWRP